MTIFLGTALSLVTGGRRTARVNLRFTSPVFLNFWKRFRYMRRTFQLQGDERKNGVAVLQPKKRGDEDEELVRLDTELAPMNKESDRLGGCPNDSQRATININEPT
nr:uncharacterized protein LOC129388270 [Dermacentor andersoni]